MKDDWDWTLLDYWYLKLNMKLKIIISYTWTVLWRQVQWTLRIIKYLSSLTCPVFADIFAPANCSFWQQVIVWWGPGNQTTQSMMIIIIITVVQSNLSLSSANPFKLYSPESVCYNCVVSPGNLHAWLILVSDQVMTSADHRDHINSVDQLSSGLQCLPTDRVNWYLEWTILSWARTLNIDVDQLISDDHNISNDNKQTITDSAASLPLIMKLCRR